jgi:hypothetical protein
MTANAPRNLPPIAPSTPRARPPVREVKAEQVEPKKPEEAPVDQGEFDPPAPTPEEVALRERLALGFAPEQTKEQRLDHLFHFAKAVKQVSFVDAERILDHVPKRRSWGTRNGQPAFFKDMVAAGLGSWSPGFSHLDVQIVMLILSKVEPIDSDQAKRLDHLAKSILRWTKEFKGKKKTYVADVRTYARLLIETAQTRGQPTGVS